ncbi:MAG: hypothetical protein HY289_07570, partial [Planctomycetes bacterium]|nr:hypothetical protein [Planctomycetota bacterium]
NGGYDTHSDQGADAPDGQHFAAAGPRTIRLWDRGSDKEVRRFGGADVVGQSAVFSPDGKLVAAGIEKGGIRFWDAATATVLRDVPAHRATVTSLAFPDGGKTLVSGSLDGTAIVWDLDRLLNETSADKAELEQLWTALGQPDAEKAAQAMRAFAARPKETRAFFKERIRPIPIVDAKRLDQLLIDLHSNQFAVRQRANDELEKLDGQARSALEKALQDDPAVETRRRIETLLQRLEPPISAPHLLRNLRAIEVTERIGTAEAYAFLQLLADGGAGHRLTEQAREAVVRLTKRP